MNTSTGYIGEVFKTNLPADVQAAPFLLERPETWNYDVEGEPDYLVMALPGSPTHKHYTKN